MNPCLYPASRPLGHVVRVKDSLNFDSLVFHRRFMWRQMVKSQSWDVRCLCQLKWPNKFSGFHPNRSPCETESPSDHGNPGTKKTNENEDLRRGPNRGNRPSERGHQRLIDVVGVETSTHPFPWSTEEHYRVSKTWTQSNRDYPDRIQYTG